MKAGEELTYIRHHERTHCTLQAAAFALDSRNKAALTVPRRKHGSRLYNKLQSGGWLNVLLWIIKSKLQLSERNRHNFELLVGLNIAFLWYTEKAICVVRVELLCKSTSLQPA